MLVLDQREAHVIVAVLAEADARRNGHARALNHLLSKFERAFASELCFKLAQALQLPDERTGLVFVFRTFDQVSYALVMESSRSVTTNDVVQKP